MWGATPLPDFVAHYLEFQSTLPVWGATDKLNSPDEVARISIHAPRVGSDVGNVEITYSVSISIHAPRVGSDSKDAQIFLLHLRQKWYFL